ncbi:1,4-dihydroxy-2-naphthoate octaprenyltransferase [Parabacteroides sp. PFB2-10]|uniref:1,4-dihydroxy-2-naphthoate polyprenyltransferase n=1 Tax=Parabacteroides sp. PFB2-10 TaxID=1742405 RepID=UPI0024760855|nr:1,4-dihydroxy-2-naphthoate polyprenyltransferase [Parabacteroides sp. PFB2-10]MDH6311881.1 1,4-dihydroxy-2-naphthoate octaprenyltransferase [Parabacteroides sp. PFB2-10]MDL2244009.1 1,4-dihydroxy-2-naphthoate polyprenyltransferase [Parabacteroides sp. OttesenSCG-928-J18]
MEDVLKKNRMKAWVEAARPRTLFASLSPVLVGWALAEHDDTFFFIPAILCLCVALLAQIASNFANDYFDFKKGADREDRLGPDRAVASGWISPKAMLVGTFLTLGAACLCGCLLLFYGGWILLPVGLLMAITVLAYSAGPFPLAYNGLGDVCVLLFYGVVPVCFTYFVQAGTFTLSAFLLSLAVGFLSINILVVNNYRDYEQDKISQKRTTIVLFGKRYGRIIYLVNGLLAGILTIPVFYRKPWWVILFFILYYILFLRIWRLYMRLEGKALNSILGRTSMMVFLYTLLVSILLLFFA